MNAYVEAWAESEQLYYKVGKASDINEGEFTFKFTPNDGTAEVLDVKMKTLANGNTNDFSIVIPESGSTVIVVYETAITAFCVLAEKCKLWRLTLEEWIIKCDDVKVETASWVFNGGDFKGLIKIEELTEKLNDLKDTVNDLIQKFNTHVHPGVTIGAQATQATLTTQDDAEDFDKDDYEDTKITH